MAEFAIRFENVSKRYRIGRPRSFTGFFSDAVNHLSGRGLPDRKHLALRDVSFEVAPGESLGLVGANGSGKTTLLKLLSRVTWPTEGRIHIAGRVISLIELGAGFHPDLTGRENIYLHGGILGLRRDEIARRLDDIVEFAGIDRFLDTPVKWFSSGMYARLGFSVAAYSNPDVLLVDEVLAVGDASFQRRAINRMQEFVREGRTVLFVSHDLDNVRGLCRQVLWLDKGVVRALGPTEDIVGRYLDDVNSRAVSQQQASDRSDVRPGTGEVRFTNWCLGNAGPDGPGSIRSGDSLIVRAEYQAFQRVQRPHFRFLIFSPRHALVVGSAESALEDEDDWIEGSGTVECRFDGLPLAHGQYTVHLAIAGEGRLGLYDYVAMGPSFVVRAEKLNGAASEDRLIEMSHSIRVLDK